MRSFPAGPSLFAYMRHGAADLALACMPFSLYMYIVYNPAWVLMDGSGAHAM